MWAGYLVDAPDLNLGPFACELWRPAYSQYHPVLFCIHQAACGSGGNRLPRLLPGDMGITEKGHNFGHMRVKIRAHE